MGKNGRGKYKRKKGKKYGRKKGKAIKKKCANPKCRNTFEVPSRYAGRAGARKFCSTTCSNRGNARVLKDLKTRFKEKLKKKGKCLLWTGGTNGSKDVTHRYGIFKIGKQRILAHRFAYQLATGKKVPKNKILIHTCRNTLCCNPKHLKLGTHSDFSEKSRQKGAKHWKTDLTAKDVRYMRKRYKDSGNDRAECEALAEEYGLKSNTVYSIVRGYSWKSVK